MEIFSSTLDPVRSRWLSQDPPARVVGFRVEPFSVRHTFKSITAYWDGAGTDLPPLSTCDKDDFVNPVKMPAVSVLHSRSSLESMA